MFKYGLILNCKNLQETKLFYANFLELGAPAVDRIDWVEFYIKETQSSLVLQEFKDDITPTNHTLVFYTSNYQDLVTKLTKEGYSLNYEKKLVITEQHQFFKDIEDNIFVLIDKSDKI